MQYEKSKIEEQLQRILKDKSFSRSKINGRLLRFLVHASIEGKKLKEVIIGEELFGKSYDPVRDDNKVRVYVYHLRKKLSEYYENHLEEDSIVFTIEKGGYEVTFSVWNEPHPEPKNRSKTIATLLGILAIALVATWLLSKRQSKNLFWNETLTNGKTTTVLFGDFFTISGPIATGGRGIIRDLNINTPEELEAYKKVHEQENLKLEPTKHPYLGGHVPYCTQLIGDLFHRYNQRFRVNLISHWDEAGIQSDNLIYFGPAKTMRILQKIVTDAYPQYTFEAEKLVRKDPLTGESTEYNDIISYENKITDYTVVGKISMPDGNQFLFMMSDQDCGIIRMLEYFSDRQEVKRFYAQHQIKDQDYLAIFKVTGWQRKSYEMEFVLIDFKN